MEQGPAWATCGEALAHPLISVLPRALHFTPSLCVMGSCLLGWPGMALLFPWGTASPC